MGVTDVLPTHRPLPGRSPPAQARPRPRSPPPRASPPRRLVPQRSGDGPLVAFFASSCRVHLLVWYPAHFAAGARCGARPTIWITAARKARFLPLRSPCSFVITPVNCRHPIPVIQVRLAVSMPRRQRRWPRGPDAEARHGRGGAGAASSRAPCVMPRITPDERGPLRLDLPGLGIATVARGFGCHAADAETTQDLQREFTTALAAGTPTVIVVPTPPQKAMLQRLAWPGASAGCQRANHRDPVTTFHLPGGEPASGRAPRPG